MTVMSKFSVALAPLTKLLSEVAKENISLTEERNRLRAENETLRRVSKQVRDYTPYKDAISPGVPKGYDTVLGFLAKYRPGVFDDMGDAWLNPHETLRDGLWCAARAKGKEVWVKACPAMKARGIEKLRAYPLEILKERFPE